MGKRRLSTYHNMGLHSRGFIIIHFFCDHGASKPLSTFHFQYPSYEITNLRLETCYSIIRTSMHSSILISLTLNPTCYKPKFSQVSNLWDSPWIDEEEAANIGKKMVELSLDCMQDKSSFPIFLPFMFFLSFYF